MSAEKKPRKHRSAQAAGAKAVGTKTAGGPAALPEPEGNRYFHRDESWMKFNERVLDEACDDSNPLLERVKFLAITASNLDEFVEIRVAGILQRLEDGFSDTQGQAQLVDEGGLTAEQRLERVSAHMARFVAAQYRCWNKQLLPALAKAGVRVLPWKKLGDEARAFAESFYEREVDPLLTR